MKIKICGMQSLTDITYANQAMPDYIGFVFAQSKRRISYETAVTLRKQLHPDILAVGVFVDAQTAEVIRLLEENVIDLAQLHGKETPEDVERIKESTKKPLIKAIREQDIATAKYWATSAVDYLLFDSG
ncbi:MAG: phosphoribosylanthranilate isomerase, partial [Lachnospiraceae bacterium]|nr:phosphoribosylanthranilate isomerase [Lachnospiraceae bacterium]